jgi:hypothetical protein
MLAVRILSNQRTCSRVREAYTAIVVALAAMGAVPAAAHAAPGWALSALSYPTNLSPTPATSPRVSGTLTVNVFNIGSTAAGCTLGLVSKESEIPDERLRQCTDPNAPENDPITITDRLPLGVRAVAAGELNSLGSGIQPSIGDELWSCTGNGPGSAPKIEGATEITCVNKATRAPEEENSLPLISGGGGAPTWKGQEAGIVNPVPILGIAINVQPGAQEHETNSATIAGGGAPTEAETTDPIVVAPEPPPYGLTTWTGWLSNADGTIDTQAGSHPYEGVFDLSLATAVNQANHRTEISGGELRTAEIELPQGFVGDPTAVPQCPRFLLVAEQCPPETMIGTTAAYFPETPPQAVPVFNMVPPPGVPAEFGFSLQSLNTYLDASVRTGSDYGVTEHVSDVAHKAITQAITTIWNLPNDPSHARWHDAKTSSGGCSLEKMEAAGGECSLPLDPPKRPLLTLPTGCGSTLPFVLRSTSWTGNTAERTFYMHGQQDEDPLTLTGCEALAFNPGLTIEPELSTTDSPTGLSVDVKPSVGGLQQPNGRSAAPIHGAKVSLPAGFVVNPGEAASLQACSEAQAALTTPAERAGGQENTGASSCPPASKVGTAVAKSPILEAAEEKQLTGNVYLLSSNPPHLKLLAALSGDGVNVKLVLDAELNEQTGQIVTTVSEAPELPVSDFKLIFDGGERASVDTPTRCGIYDAEAVFTPWTAPLESSFAATAMLGVSADVGGAVCPSSSGGLPFGPDLTAGSTNPVAGAFTPLQASISRSDGSQRISGFQLTTPPGVAAILAGVSLCGEPQAALGSCEESSLIGHASVESGPGPHPLSVPQPGEPAPKIFVTGPYDGAPFGLSIVTPVIAGPFNLGTIVTRGRITIDPHTAQVTVTTDPLPQIIDGISTDLRVVGATVDRPSFMFNPTSCEPNAVDATVTGVEGASAAVSNHFQVTGCRELPFAPKLTASTAGHTSKQSGAGLSVKVTARPGEANIHKVDLQLPLALPARLSTLQQACTEARFNTNPAGCPAASVIGTAIAHTPVLQVPLTGPAYLVSHGGAAFPDVEFVLQANERGGVVNIVLDGGTQIKKGITYSHFETVPDAPISSFETALPEGPHSVLATNIPASANNSLCGRSLQIPTTITAQNGTVLSQGTPVAVEGCSTALTLKYRGVKQKTLTLSVYAPAAGRITANGKGLTSQTKTGKGQTTVTLTLKQKQPGRLKTTVKVAFTPSTGKDRKKQIKTFKVTFKK